jgi:hypothetical protein
MQCPNCYADTTAMLPRCTRCNALLAQPPQQQLHQQQPVEQVERPYTPGTDAQRQLDTWALRYPEQEDAGRVVTEPRPALSRGRRALLIVAVVLVVAGGGLAAGIAFWPRGDHPPVSSAPISAPPNPAATSDDTTSGESASSEPGPVAHDQAVAIDELLDEMASSRTKLGGAVSDAFRCDELTARPWTR